nr:hypothetical protein [Tanacetum cinerariifolium]
MILAKFKNIHHDLRSLNFCNKDLARNEDAEDANVANLSEAANVAQASPTAQGLRAAILHASPIRMTKKAAKRTDKLRVAVSFQLGAKVGASVVLTDDSSRLELGAEVGANVVLTDDYRDVNKSSAEYTKDNSNDEDNKDSHSAEEEQNTKDSESVKTPPVKKRGHPKKIVRANENKSSSVKR